MVPVKLCSFFYVMVLAVAAGGEGAGAGAEVTNYGLKIPDIGL